jgi:hypothetical protein
MTLAAIKLNNFARELQSTKGDTSSYHMVKEASGEPTLRKWPQDFADNSHETPI